jgi:hypothetical protein
MTLRQRRQIEAPDLENEATEGTEQSEKTNGFFFPFSSMPALLRF